MLWPGYGGAGQLGAAAAAASLAPTVPVVASLRQHAAPAPAWSFSDLAPAMHWQHALHGFGVGDFYDSCNWAGAAGASSGDCYAVRKDADVVAERCSGSQLADDQLVTCQSAFDKSGECRALESPGPLDVSGFSELPCRKSSAESPAESPSCARPLSPAPAPESPPLPQQERPESSDEVIEIESLTGDEMLHPDIEPPHKEIGPLPIDAPLQSEQATCSAHPDDRLQLDSGSITKQVTPVAAELQEEAQFQGLRLLSDCVSRREQAAQNPLDVLCAAALADTAPPPSAAIDAASPPIVAEPVLRSKLTQLHFNQQQKHRELKLSSKPFIFIK